MYLSESIIRIILKSYFDISNFLNSSFLSVIIFANVCLVMIGGIIIEFFRRKTFAKLDQYVLKLIYKVFNVLKRFIKDLEEKK